MSKPVGHAFSGEGGIRLLAPKEKEPEAAFCALWTSDSRPSAKILLDLRIQALKPP